MFLLLARSLESRRATRVIGVCLFTSSVAFSSFGFSLHAPSSMSYSQGSHSRSPEYSNRIECMRQQPTPDASQCVLSALCDRHCNRRTDKITNESNESLHTDKICFSDTKSNANVIDTFIVDKIVSVLLAALSMSDVCAVRGKHKRNKAVPNDDK